MARGLVSWVGWGGAAGGLPDPGAARLPGPSEGPSGEAVGIEMRDVDLFQMALGLESPWYVDRTEFDVEAKRLDLYLDFRQGGRFTCPECGKGGCLAHDTTEKTGRHLDSSSTRRAG